MIFRLQEWAIREPKAKDTSDLYKAPELKKYYLIGKVFDHPYYPNGHKISTSYVIGIDEHSRVAHTESGSHYKLENPREDYVMFVKRHNPDWKYKGLLLW